MVERRPQLTGEQLATAGGIVLDEIVEEVTSSVGSDRPKLRALVGRLEGSMTLHVQSMDRLGKDVTDLLHWVVQVLERKASLMFHTEGLYIPGGTYALNTPQLQLLKGLARAERALINERAADGRRKARDAGKSLGRPQAFGAAEKQEIRGLDARPAKV